MASEPTDEDQAKAEDERLIERRLINFGGRMERWKEKQITTGIWHVNL